MPSLSAIFLELIVLFLTLASTSESGRQFHNTSEKDFKKYVELIPEWLQPAARFIFGILAGFSFSGFAGLKLADFWIIKPAAERFGKYDRPAKMLLIAAVVFFGLYLVVSPILAVVRIGALGVLVGTLVYYLYKNKSLPFMEKGKPSDEKEEV